MGQAENVGGRRGDAAEPTARGSRPGAAAATEDRLLRLSLPQPLEQLLYDALVVREPAERHRRAVLAWEAAIQVSASAVWGVCRRIGRSSSGFREQCQKLRKPTLGVWHGLQREGVVLLADRPEREARVLAPLVEGLLGSAEESRDFHELETPFASLPKPIRPEGSRRLDFVAAVTAYRNRSEGHVRNRPPASSLENNADVLIRALLALCEAAPPIGGFGLVAVDRVVQSPSGMNIQLVTMHRSRAIPEERSVDSARAATLRPGWLYLWTEDGPVVPLWPIAAARGDEDIWRVALLDGRVGGPRFLYAPVGAKPFERELGDEEYEALLGLAPLPEEPALPDEVLALEPYRGLAAYDEEHAALFFGRDRPSHEIATFLEANGAVLVCGVSGSGKSSLVRAGLLPHRRERLAQVERSFVPLVLTPGADPLGALRRVLLRDEPTAGDSAAAKAEWRRRVFEALPEDGAEANPSAVEHLLAAASAVNAALLLCVDQLEETLTQCTQPESRRAFLDVLVHLARHAHRSGVPVVMTVRSDLLGGLMEHAGMRELARRASWWLEAMTPPELIEPVTAPLRGRHVEMEPGLAEQIVGDVGREPGRLALLGQVLKSLWDGRGRHGERLTVQGYEAAGRVDGAVRRRAEAAWSALDDTARTTMNRVFLRLATVGDDGQFVRNRVPLADLCEATGRSETDLRALLDGFVHERLLVLGGPPEHREPIPADRSSEAADSGDGVEKEADPGGTTVELVHEVLLHAWEHLRDLLQRHGEVIALARRVSTAAAAWDRSGRRRELWTDGTVDLRLAEQRRDNGTLDVTERERAFLAASRRHVRRRRRLAVTAVAGLAVLTVAVGILAGWALEERDRARQAEKSADSERTRAESERERAEDLTGYMLFDLRDRLEAVGRLDLLESVARKALDHYRTAAAGTETPEAAARRAAALNNVGDVLVAQGKLDESLAAFQEGLTIARRLAEHDPTNTGWQRDLSVSLDKIGNVLVAQGKLDDALAEFREGLEIRRRLAEHDPTNTQWQRDVSASLLRIGNVLVVQGRLDDALAAFQEGLTISRRLADHDPTNTEWQRDLSVSLVRIGDVLVVQGRLDDALAAFQEGLTIARRLADHDPTNTQWQRDISVSLNMIGDVLVAQGKLDDALAEFREGLEIRRRLADHDPTNTEWQRDLFVSLDRIGDVLVAQGKLDDALAAFQEGLTIARRLADHDPTNSGWQADSAYSRRKVAEVLALTAGGTAEATTLLEEAVGILRAIDAAGRMTALWRQWLAIAEDNLVEIRAAGPGGIPSVAVEATVTSVDGIDGLAPGASCRFLVRRRVVGGNPVCGTQVVCGGRRIYGGPGNFFACSFEAVGAPHIRGSDSDMTSTDGDGAMEVDTGTGTLHVWDDASGALGAFRVEARILRVE